MTLKIRLISVVVLIAASFATASGQRSYFPSAERWDRKTAEQARFDPVKLKEAVDFAIASESKAPRNLELAHYQTFGREPYGEAVGPFKERGDATGMILRGGYIVAEWGDPARVDMTFSVTKSFVSTVVGLAFDRKMIRDLRDPVTDYAAPTLVHNPGEKFDAASRMGSSPFLDLFSTPHNQKITWDHLLRQTSDWEGTLWGKPDWADRPDREVRNWFGRVRGTPGTVYEYNDVRVNVLALAALNVWRRPLPEVLKEYVMDEIGASPIWRWHGYENSWIVLDGRIMQSVSGGGHWGRGNVHFCPRHGTLRPVDREWR